jgi:hypothetical protein
MADSRFIAGFAFGLAAALTLAAALGGRPGLPPVGATLPLCPSEESNP